MIGKTPGILLRLPFRDSSPRMMESSIDGTWICLLEIKIPSAIAKSKIEPCFLSCAGARFIVFRVVGNLYPLLMILDRTRSFDS